MRICIAGAGYVGLVSAAGFAELGHEVALADIDEVRIASLRAGRLPIHEPGLSDLIAAHAASGRLTFTSDVPAAVADVDAVFVAVGTPPRSDGAADLSAVFNVAETVAAHARSGTVLALKSTVPVGTNARVRRITDGAPRKIHVASNPEFLKEGDAVRDFLEPDRVVVGCDPLDERARSVLTELYAPLGLPEDRLLVMTPPSAELTKYVANTMLALRISFMNEVAGLCEKVGADVGDVRLGVGSDTRIGPAFLFPGPGYGGSCLPKDVQALVATGREHGLELCLSDMAHRINERQKGVLLRKVKRLFDGDLRGRRIAVWGLAFKPGTDDLRESPALTFIEGLLAEGAEVHAHDPEAMAHARQRFGDTIQLASDPYAAADGADALVLVTDWADYASPDFERLHRLLVRPVLVDGRNLWAGRALTAAGFVYEGLGVQA